MKHSNEGQEPNDGHSAGQDSHEEDELTGYADPRARWVAQWLAANASDGSCEADADGEPDPRWPLEMAIDGFDYAAWQARPIITARLLDARVYEDSYSYDDNVTRYPHAPYVHRLGQLLDSTAQVPTARYSDAPMAPEAFADWWRQCQKRQARVTHSRAVECLRRGACFTLVGLGWIATN